MQMKYLKVVPGNVPAVEKRHYLDVKRKVRVRQHSGSSVTVIEKLRVDCSDFDYGDCSSKCSAMVSPATMLLQRQQAFPNRNQA